MNVPIPQDLTRENDRRLAELRRELYPLRWSLPRDAVPAMAASARCPDEVKWLDYPQAGDRLLANSTDEVFAGPVVVTLAVAPGVVMRERGQWLEVSGHYDDSAAQQCTYGEIPGQSVVSCRAQFVVDQARPVSGPG